jgi:hypothetical protein
LTDRGNDKSQTNNNAKQEGSADSSTKAKKLSFIPDFEEDDIESPTFRVYLRNRDQMLGKISAALRALFTDYLGAQVMEENGQIKFALVFAPSEQTGNENAKYTAFTLKEQPKYTRSDMFSIFTSNSIANRKPEIYTPGSEAIDILSDFIVPRNQFGHVVKEEKDKAGRIKNFSKFYYEFQIAPGQQNCAVRVNVPIDPQEAIRITWPKYKSDKKERYQYSIRSRYDKSRYNDPSDILYEITEVPYSEAKMCDEFISPQYANYMINPAMQAMYLVNNANLVR